MSDERKEPNITADCAQCGYSVDVESTGWASRSNDLFCVQVEPCAKCLAEATEEGKRDGCQQCREAAEASAELALTEKEAVEKRLGASLELLFAFMKQQSEGGATIREERLAAILLEKTQLLDELSLRASAGERPGVCLATGHNHIHRADEAICSLLYQRTQLEAELKGLIAVVDQKPRRSPDLPSGVSGAIGLGNFAKKGKAP